MNGYFAIIKIRTLALLRYRAAAFAGVCTQLFWGLVFVMIFQAFYKGASAQEPLSLQNTLTFVWIGQALLRLLPWTVDKEIEAQIKNGYVAYELIRPLHLYRLWFVKSLAICLVPTLMRAPPVFIIAGFFLQLASPISAAALLGFAAAVFFALLLSSAIATLIIISLFWTLSGEGIKRALPQLTVFLSGMIVPLPLFPSWMQPFLNWQPFRGIIDIPSRIYTGVIPADQILYYLAFQAAWLLVFIGFGKWLMSRAQNRFVVQGG
jgi:ABC-2 type transport system permease protein